jgi:excisionase family DNA binding protein
MGADSLQRGYTPRELARVLRISPDRVRAMIQSGELGAISMARTQSGRPRYVILPCHLDAYVRGQQVSAPPRPAPRRRRRTTPVDYYPD